MKKVKIYLLWGTFAKDAEWVQPQSNFRKMLKTALAGKDIEPEYRVHDWSGINSHKERNEAAKKLSDSVCDSTLELESDAPPFFIGHSHGGSVAFLAAAKVKEKLGFAPRVITLGTPFLLSKRRNIFLSTLILFFAVFFYSVFTLLPAMQLLLLLSHDAYLPIYIYIPALIVSSIFILFWLILTMVNSRLTRNYGFEHSANEIESYSLFTWGDEARIVLLVWGALTFFAQLCWWVFLLIPFVYVGLFFTFGIETDVLTMILDEDCGVQDIVIKSGLSDTVLLFCLFLVTLISVTIGILRGSWMAFGGENPTLHLTHRIRTFITGNSASQCDYVGLQNTTGIRHSRFYENKKCVENISEKISNWNILSSKSIWNFGLVIRPALLFGLSSLIIFLLLSLISPSIEGAVLDIVLSCIS